MRETTSVGSVGNSRRKSPDPTPRTSRNAKVSASPRRDGRFITTGRCCPAEGPNRARERIQGQRTEGEEAHQSRQIITMSAANQTRDVSLVLSASRKGGFLRGFARKQPITSSSTDVAQRVDVASPREGSQGRDEPTPPSPPLTGNVPEREVNVFLDKGNELFAKGSFDEALKMYYEALLRLNKSNITVETDKGPKPMARGERKFRTARCLVNIGVVHIRQDNSVDALSALELSSSQSKLVERESPFYRSACEVLADSLENRGLVHFKIHEWELSQEFYAEALKARRLCITLIEKKEQKLSRKISRSKEQARKSKEEKESCQLDLANTLYYMALLLEKGECIEEALSYCEEAVSLRKAVIPELSDDVSGTNVFSLIGRLYCHENVCRYSDALPFCNEIHRRKCERFGREKLEVVPTMNMIAFIYNKKGNYGKAITISDHSLKITTNGRGLNKETCAAFTNKGDGCVGMGDLETAILCYEAGLEIQLKILSQDDFANVPLLQKLADCYADVKDYEKAINAQERVMELKLTHHGTEPSEEHAASCSILGDYYNGNNDPTAAIKCHTRALRIYKHFGAKDYAAKEHNRIAGILKNNCQPSQAMEHYVASLYCAREARLPSTDPIVADTIRNVAAYDDQDVEEAVYQLTE